MDELMFRAFHVEVTPSDRNYDPSLPPTTGNEYLLRVQEEAKRCPSVVVAADLDTSRFVANQTVKVSNSSGCPAPPEGFSPSWKWQRHQLFCFSQVRQRLAAYRASPRRVGQQPYPPVLLPRIEDDIGWCQLCFGRSEDSGGYPPLLAVVLSMSQVHHFIYLSQGFPSTEEYIRPLLEQVLTYHISWLEVAGFTTKSHQQGRWFYALLSCLEKPLTPETCSSLRTLARACAGVRATLESADDPRLTPLNLFVCLIAHYFDQKDLAD